MGKSVNNWIGKWVNDIVNKDNVSHSIHLCRHLLVKCNNVRRVHAEIVLKIFYPDKTERTERIWNRVSAYIVYNWEAMVIYSRSSLILALSAVYDAAFTMLRNSLELLVKGAFYQCLTDSRLRSRWSLDEGDPASKLRRYLVNKVRTTSDQQKLENTSADIFNLLRKRLYRIHLRFPSIKKQVIDWGIISHELRRSIKRG